jgi:MFS family permease
MLLNCRELPPAPQDGTDGTPRRPTGPTTLAAWLRDLAGTLRGMAGSPAGPLVTYLCAFAFTAHIAAPYFAPFMLRQLGFSYHAFMLVIATGVLSKALALPSLGRLGSRIGSLGLLWLGGLSTIPLALLWLPVHAVPYLVAVQLLAGACWASWELAVVLLFFDAVPHGQRTGVITIYNLGLAVSQLAGAAVGGVLLRWLGEDTTAYAAIFVVSSLLRLATVPLLRRVRLPPQPQPTAN